MKKGEFDLKGKAIDCRKLPAMGEAGKDIFRALKVACNGSEYPPFTVWTDVSELRGTYLIISGGFKILSSASSVKLMNLKIIQPSDVLGQAAINAAIDDWNRAKIVPNTKVRILSFEHQSYIKTILNIDTTFAFINVFNGYDDKLFMYIDCLEYNLAKEIFIELPGVKAPNINARVLAEKVGFKELRPVRSPNEWKEREREAYGDLRDANLDLVIEIMDKEKQIKLLKQKIKDLHRAMNDAKAALDV
jgi:hypothetical protein